MEREWVLDLEPSLPCMAFANIFISKMERKMLNNSCYQNVQIRKFLN